MIPENAKIKKAKRNPGFTLLELLLATSIATLVVGIVALALTFTMRLWEKTSQQPTSDELQLLQLLKWQLSTFYPFPVVIDQKSQPIFFGDDHSITFASGFSVRALSRGAPVVVRYFYSTREKKLFYSELPFDPYHPKNLKSFFEIDPEKAMDRQKRPRFWGVDIIECRFSYLDPEQDRYVDEWENGNPPKQVRVQLKLNKHEPKITWYVIPGFLLSR